MFDDIIEFTKEHSIKYKDIFLRFVGETFCCFGSIILICLYFRPLLEYITDKSPEVRQAASYGVGVMAQFAGQTYTDAIKGNDSGACNVPFQ